MNDEIKKILDDLLFTTTLPNISVKLSEEKLYQLKVYITDLQQENENLKQRIEFKNTFNNFVNNKYKSRCEKAIEYIKSVYKRNEDGTDNIWIFDFGEIENILNGGDE